MYIMAIKKILKNFLTYRKIRIYASPKPQNTDSPNIYVAALAT